jgi:Fe-S-cluster containining protein
MSEDMVPVGPDDEMTFECSSKNKCFNECCRDLNQALTPYDVLRLKNSLKMSSQQFLREYTSLHYGPESGLPVVGFKPNPDTGYECPFVTSQGCRVYNDRPASCRMYPLARAVARSRETGEITQYFALIEEPHCKGFGKKSGQTVREWLAGQDVDRHNACNDKLMEVISLKNRIMPGKLDGVQADTFYLALYDLDEFRSRIKNGGLLDELNIPEQLLDYLNSDEVLLDFGIEWVKYRLFGVEMDIGG